VLKSSPLDSVDLRAVPGVVDSKFEDNCCFQLPHPTTKPYQVREQVIFVLAKQSSPPFAINDRTGRGRRSSRGRSLRDSLPNIADYSIIGKYAAN